MRNKRTLDEPRRKKGLIFYIQHKAKHLSKPTGTTIYCKVWSKADRIYVHNIKENSPKNGLKLMTVCTDNYSYCLQFAFTEEPCYL